MLISIFLMIIISTSLTVPTQPSPRFHVEAWLPFRNREMDYFGARKTGRDDSYCSYNPYMGQMAPTVCDRYFQGLTVSNEYSLNVCRKWMCLSSSSSVFLLWACICSNWSWVADFLGSSRVKRSRRSWRVKYLWSRCEQKSTVRT